MQLGKFTSDYIDFKNDTKKFGEYVDNKMAEEQERSTKGDNNGENS